MASTAASSTNGQNPRESNQSGVGDSAVGSAEPPPPAEGAGVKNGQQKGRMVAQDCQDGVGVAVVEISSGARAMRNEEVLLVISRKLPTKDLLALRGTCAIWNYNFVPAIQQIHRPIKLENVTRGNESNQLKDFIACMRLSRKIPFTNFVLEGKKTTPDARATMLDFFGVCGPSVRILSLRPVDVTDSSFMSMDMMQLELFQMAPNLEELHIDTAAIEPWNSSEVDKFQIQTKIPKLRRLLIRSYEYGFQTDPPSPFQYLLNELVRCCTNLESLDLRSWSLSAALALQNGNLAKFRSLEVNYWLPNDLCMLADLTHRKQNPLTLSEFKIYVYHYADFVPIDSLGTFLIAQEPFLQNLVLVCPSTERRDIQIPKLDRLRNFERSFVQLTYEDGTLANTFPALKTLTCEPSWYCPESQEQESPIGVRWIESHPGITDLVLRPVEIRQFLYLGLEFPTLTRLHISMQSATMDDFRQLWTRWPALEYLHVECHALQSNSTLNLDEWLTGIPESAFKALKDEITGAVATGKRRKRWSTISLNLDRIRELAPKYKTEPGISDLTRLKKLSLDLCPTWPGWGPPTYKMTDIGGYFGVAIAGTYLQHISAKVGEEFGTKKIRISPRCMRMIREALGPLPVIEL